MVDDKVSDTESVILSVFRDCTRHMRHVFSVPLIPLKKTKNHAGAALRKVLNGLTVLDAH